jgi:cell wall-associated NlpC family hydrolase
VARRDERGQQEHSAYRKARTARKRGRLARRLLLTSSGGFLIALLGLSVLVVYVAGTAIGGAEAERQLAAACGLAAPVADDGPAPPRTEDDAPSFIFDSRNIARVAANAGFAGEDLVIAVAVARAESNGNPSAINTSNSNGSTDYGLWQINSVHGGSGFDPARSRDPEYNAMWAYRIYEAAGRQWRPWTTYNTGAYREFLPVARAAAENVGAVTVDDLARDSGHDLTGTGECSSETPMTVQGFGRSQSINAGAGTAISFARQQIGDPYQWGAIGPDSWDCSSLVQAAWATAGVRLPRVSRYQHAAVTPVSQRPVSEPDIRPGDLIFYGNPVHHVAMYTGNGMIIEAAQAGVPVRERSVYWDGLRSVGRPAA